MNLFVLDNFVLDNYNQQSYCSLSNDCTFCWMVVILKWESWYNGCIQSLKELVTGHCSIFTYHWFGLTVPAHIPAEIVVTCSCQQERFLRMLEISCLKGSLQYIRARLGTFNDILPKLPCYKISKNLSICRCTSGQTQRWVNRMNILIFFKKVFY